MQKRRLGQGMDVSVIGLGTVKFGRNQGVKYPSSFSLPSDQELHHLLSLAQEGGINLLDTAPAYGISEERLGKVLQGKRQDWLISTKVGEEFSDGESRFDFSAVAIRQSIERSLQRLKTDYLDIVLVHSNGDDEKILSDEEAFHTLGALKEEGKIRAFGMSTKTLSGGLLTIEKADLAMVTYNPTYTAEREVIHYAAQKQKGIFIKKALASGHWQGTLLEAFQFIFAEPGVTSIIIGTVNPKHLQEWVDACSSI